MPFLQVQKQVQIQVQNHKYDTFLQVLTKMDFSEFFIFSKKFVKIGKNKYKILKISTKTSTNTSTNRNLETIKNG